MAAFLVIAFYLLAGLLVIGVLGGFWLYAKSSRKTYVCPQCGEVHKNMEFMDASHCNVCGARFAPQQ